MKQPNANLANPRVTSFLGGSEGEWAVSSQTTLAGDPIESVTRVAMSSGSLETSDTATWILRGAFTNDRYTTRPEKTELMSKQAPIGRHEATRSALILLRKNAEWWSFTQEERREILEEQSHHIAIGMRYLPAVARRLLHCRDLATQEPFDFLGFLDFAPENEPTFNQMLDELRATQEWSFIDRDIDIRLSKN